MKCVFRDEDCIRKGESHDECRHCRYVPTMVLENDVEMRCLSAVAGQREKQLEFYGSVSGKVPKWVKAIIKNNEGLGDFIPCTDHRKYLKEMVVNEPYNVHMDKLKELITFCDENGLSFIIDGNSVHFPGRCIRILITKPL